MTPTDLTVEHCDLCGFAVSARTIEAMTRALLEHAIASHGITVIPRPQ